MNRREFLKACGWTAVIAVTPAVAFAALTRPPIFMGMDFAKPGSDETVLLRSILVDGELSYVCMVNPDLFTAQEVAEFRAETALELGRLKQPLVAEYGKFE